MSQSCVCPENQLIHDYLIHKSQGLKQNDNNMHIKINILRACKSVKKYPLPITCQADALKLNGVGHTISKEIVKIIQNGNERKKENLTEHLNTKYNPELGKVPWAILVAMQILGGNGNKTQLEYEITKLTSTYDFVHGESFKDTNFHAIKSLKKYGLIEEVELSHFWLTTGGLVLADKLYLSFKQRIATQSAPTTTSNDNNMTTKAIGMISSNNNNHNSTALLQELNRDYINTSSTARLSYVNINNSNNYNSNFIEDNYCNNNNINNDNYINDDSYNNNDDNYNNDINDEGNSYMNQIKKNLVRDSTKTVTATLSVSNNNIAIPQPQQTFSSEVIDLCSPAPELSRRRKLQHSNSSADNTNVTAATTNTTDRLFIDEGNDELLLSPAPSTIRQCRNSTPVFSIVKYEFESNDHVSNISDHDEEQQVGNVEGNGEFDENSFEEFDEYVIPLHVRLKYKYHNSTKDSIEPSKPPIADKSPYIKPFIINNTTQSNFIDLTEDDNELPPTPQSKQLNFDYDKYTTINPPYNNSNNNNKAHSRLVSKSDSRNNFNSGSQTISSSLFNQLQEAPSLASCSLKPPQYSQTIRAMSDDLQAGAIVGHYSEAIATTTTRTTKVPTPAAVSIYQLLQQKERELKISNKSIVQNTATMTTTTTEIQTENYQTTTHSTALNKTQKRTKRINETNQSNLKQINELSSASSHVLETTTITTTSAVNRSYYIEKILVPLPSTVPKWEVVLLIDTRERDNALIQSIMVAKGIRCELFTLAVGDFLWITRPCGTYGTTSAALSSSQSQYNEEMDSRMSIPDQVNTDIFVLDCVAERKTIADLASSIIDGRYMEQKARLKACSLRSTMYIIEGEHIILPRQHKAITAAHIKTAIVSINVDNSMHVVRTRSIDHTITYLQSIHRQVQARFERSINTYKHLPITNIATTAAHRNYNTSSSSTSTSVDSIKLYQPFSQFQILYEKKGATTNKQLFGHQLRQIQGVSVSVALALMDKYGTTSNFMLALLAMGEVKAEYLLSNLLRHGSTKRFGPALAKRLCQVYLGSY